VTIVVGAASPDGIVLAADSRTTLSDGQRHRISTDVADKVFELNSKFGVATYGLAGIGPRTINGLMDEFVATANEDVCADVETFASALGGFFHERYVAAFGATETDGWPLGFVVAGYDDAGIGHVWEVGVPGPKVGQTQVNTADQGALWRGQVDVIGRLIKGVDWNALDAAGLTFDGPAQETLERLEYILLQPVTLQDAADMASFLVRTTIDMQRFSDGTVLAQGLIPGCGGRTQMLAVKRSGVEWISRRRLTGASRPGWAEGGAEFDA
jgi:Proteasome subunit